MSLIELEKELDHVAKIKDDTKSFVKRGRLISLIKNELARINKKKNNSDEEKELIIKLENLLEETLERHKDTIDRRYKEEFLREEVRLGNLITLLPKGLSISTNKVKACIEELKLVKSFQEKKQAVANVMKALGQTAGTPIVYTGKVIAKYWYLLLLLLSLRFPRFNKDSDKDKNKKAPDPRLQEQEAYAYNEQLSHVAKRLREMEKELGLKPAPIPEKVPIPQRTIAEELTGVAKFDPIAVDKPFVSIEPAKTMPLNRKAFYHETGIQPIKGLELSNELSANMNQQIQIEPNVFNSSRLIKDSTLKIEERPIQNEAGLGRIPAPRPINTVNAGRNSQVPQPSPTPGPHEIKPMPGAKPVHNQLSVENSRAFINENSLGFEDIVNTSAYPNFEAVADILKTHGVENMKYFDTREDVINHLRSDYYFTEERANQICNEISRGESTLFSDIRWIVGEGGIFTSKEQLNNLLGAGNQESIKSGLLNYVNEEKERLNSFITSQEQRQINFNQFISDAGKYMGAAGLATLILATAAQTGNISPELLQKLQTVLDSVKLAPVLK